jgi:hypothetical protein
LWRATSGTKGDLPFHRTSATVANILHTFLKLQEAVQAWQTRACRDQKTSENPQERF